MQDFDEQAFAQLQQFAQPAASDAPALDGQVSDQAAPAPAATESDAANILDDVLARLERLERLAIRNGWHL